MLGQPGYLGGRHDPFPSPLSLHRMGSVSVVSHRPLSHTGVVGPLP